MSVTVDFDSIEKLKAALALFLETYLKTKILDRNSGTLRMQILHAKNNKNKSIKEKMINYKLLRLDERLLTDHLLEMPLKDYHVCEFLIEELMKYVKGPSR